MPMQAIPLESGQKLSLKNDGALDVFFIGVGSAFASTVYQTNFLLIQGDQHVMVDFGMTGPEALSNTARLKSTDIEVLLPTHSHADHIGGIECLALMNRYVGQKFLNKSKLKVIINQEYQRILWDYSLRGGLEWNEESAQMGRPLCFGDYFDVIRPMWKAKQPREIYELTLGDMHLEIFRTKHIPEKSANWEDAFVSYGLYVNNRVFISCDTQFDRELIDMYASRSEVMFHDVQFFPGAVHAPLQDLRTLPDDIKKKMHFIHYADNYREQDISGFAGYAQQGTIYRFT